MTSHRSNGSELGAGEARRSPSGRARAGHVDRPATAAAGALVVALGLMVGCASTGPAPSSSAEEPSSAASRPSLASATAAAASVAATASPTPASATSFVSKLYGYSLTLPAGWTSVQARTAWDGLGAPGHDGPIVDQLIGRAAPIAWAYAGPTTTTLASFAKARDAADAAGHPCPAVPDTSDAITIDGEPGLVQAKDCGILVMNALAIREGVGFVFYLQDPSGNRAADSADRASFLALLETVRLPN